MKKTKTTSPRVQRNRDATISAILDKARIIMREEGVAALSMHELARRMEIRAPSLYNYFNNKMEIYDALFRMGFNISYAQLQEALKRSKNPHDEFRIMIESYMSFALENPELYQLCFERPVPGFVPSKESLALSFGILNEAYARIEKIKKQFHTKLTAQQIVDMTIAIAHGLTALHLANEPQLPTGQGRFGSLIPTFVNFFETSIPTKGETK